MQLKISQKDKKIFVSEKPHLECVAYDLFRNESQDVEGTQIISIWIQ